MHTISQGLTAFLVGRLLGRIAAGAADKEITNGVAVPEIGHLDFKIAQFRVRLRSGFTLYPLKMLFGLAAGWVLLAVGVSISGSPTWIEPNIM